MPSDGNIKLARLWKEKVYCVIWSLTVVQTLWIFCRLVVTLPTTALPRGKNHWSVLHKWAGHGRKDERPAGSFTGSRRQGHGLSLNQLDSKISGFFHSCWAAVVGYPRTCAHTALPLDTTNPFLCRVPAPTWVHTRCSQCVPQAAATTPEEISGKTALET